MICTLRVDKARWGASDRNLVRVDQFRHSVPNEGRNLENSKLHNAKMFVLKSVCIRKAGLPCEGKLGPHDPFGCRVFWLHPGCRLHHANQVVTGSP